MVTAGIELSGGVRSPYPKGLLIGQVIDVRRDANAVVQTAFLEPAVDLDKLEYVLVITDYEGGLPPADQQPTTPDEPDGTLPDSEQPYVSPSPCPEARARRRSRSGKRGTAEMRAQAGSARCGRGVELLPGTSPVAIAGSELDLTEIEARVADPSLQAVAYPNAPTRRLDHRGRRVAAKLQRRAASRRATTSLRPGLAA